jgi:3-oxoacyl-[acyl-carrier-protein] synthase-1
MRRVVVTGIGIVSPIGHDANQVAAALRAGRSGIVFAPDYAENGFRCQVHGDPRIVLEDHIDKRQLRFMGPGAAYNYIAMEQAIADSGLDPSDVSNERTGLIMGSGGPSTSNFFLAHQIVKEKGSPKRMGPFMVTRCMSSTNSACLATPFKIKGVNYSITSACSTSAHCIGNAAEQIQLGKQDVVFAGGGEELDWTLSCLFDAMGAMSSKYNDTPSDRVPSVRRQPGRFRDRRRRRWRSGSGGTRARHRSGCQDLCRTNRIRRDVGRLRHGRAFGEGGERAMRLAMAGLGERKVDYINAHGTSTPAGDVVEVEAIRRIFGEGAMPPISSTKALTGHSLGATGVHEAIYCLLMMRDGFIAGSANIETLDPAIRPGEIETETRDAPLDTVLSNSFGFGGTNATLIFSRDEG